MKIGEIVNKPPQVASTVPCDELPSCTRVGIELELEGVTSTSRGANLTYWQAVEDGSLRDGGVEYIFREPLGGQDVVDAIDEVTTFFRRKRYTTGYRTSTHVHVDVRDMDQEAFGKYVLLYVCFEEALLDYCGKRRRDSVFAVPVMDSAYLLRRYHTLMNPRRRSSPFAVAGTARYSAMNPESVAKFGSLEFRSHGGCVDRDRLIEWVSILLHMQQCAEESEGDNLEMVYELYRLGHRRGLQAVFGEYARKLRITSAQYEAALLRAKALCSYSAISHAAAIAYTASLDNSAFMAVARALGDSVYGEEEDYEDEEEDSIGGYERRYDESDTEQLYWCGEWHDRYELPPSSASLEDMETHSVDGRISYRRTEDSPWRWANNGEFII